MAKTSAFHAEIVSSILTRGTLLLEYNLVAKWSADNA